VSSHPLERILNPHSIAIIGASADPTKRGHQVMRALKEGGYPGAIYPVNPKGGRLLDLEVYPTIGEVPAAPDLAYIGTRAEAVPGALAACGRKGVRAAVVPGVGFREIGGAGEALERELGAIAQETGIRVIGPNTSGLLNPWASVNLVGVRGVPRGEIAILAQSGNVALALMTEVAEWASGVSLYVGVGNEADIRFDEYLDYLAGHERTRVIVMYAEGFHDGRRFLETARRVTRHKPIVLLKGGRTEGGVVAARSHTGAIAGSYPVLRAALRQSGVTEVSRSDELMAVAFTLARQPVVPPGRGVAILGDGGGHGTLAVDALAGAGVPLARLAESTSTRLRAILGGAANVANPVDVAGATDRNPSAFADAARLLLKDPGVGGVLLVGLYGGYGIRFSSQYVDDEVATSSAIADAAAEAGLPLVVYSLYAPHRPEALEMLKRRGVPVVGSLESASRCMAALHQRALSLAGELVPTQPPASRRDTPEVLVAARREGRLVLTEIEARQLLEEARVPVVTGTLCRTAEEAAEAAERARGPVALKAVSPAVTHKTDADALVLDVLGGESARQAFQRVMEGATRFAAERNMAPDIRGVLVAPMLTRPVAEVLVGVRRDADVGPVLTVGAGGVHVEVHKDVALRGLPVGRAEVLEMLGEVRIAALLRGFRGRAGADLERLADLILNFSACALMHPEIAEMEANPVFAYADRAVVVDARAVLFE
jgi:acetyltransferase